MPVYDELTTDMKTALKAGERKRLTTIRSMIAAVKKAAIDTGTRDEIPGDEFVEQILAKQAKMRREALDQYEKADRQDLADVERKELEVIESYLPKQLEEDEIRREVLKIIESTGAESVSDFGRVMGPVMKAMKGRADGKRVQSVVRELLAGP